MASKTLKVALNPRNPEAASWYDPVTGVNLFLGDVKDPKGNVVSGPISKDISSLHPDDLKNVVKGINAGLLIIAEGDLPEGVDLTRVPAFRAPRSRWAQSVDADGKPTDTMSKAQEQALSSWDNLLKQADKKEKSVAKDS